MSSNLLSSPSVVDGETLATAKKIAREKARCDYALMMGASASNAQLIPEFAFDVSGLKMYLNDTFTTLRNRVSEDHCFNALNIGSSDDQKGGP